MKASRYVLIPGFVLLLPVGAMAQMPAEDLAAQIREQGYRCDSPGSAKKDSELSKPDETAWVLECGNAIYRIRLVPDMAAHVEQIE